MLLGFYKQPKLCLALSFNPTRVVTGPGLNIWSRVLADVNVHCTVWTFPWIPTTCLGYIERYDIVLLWKGDSESVWMLRKFDGSMSYAWTFSDILIHQSNSPLASGSRGSPLFFGQCEGAFYCSWRARNSRVDKSTLWGILVITSSVRMRLSETIAEMSKEGKTL